MSVNTTSLRSVRSIRAASNAPQAGSSTPPQTSQDDPYDLVSAFCDEDLGVLRPAMPSPTKLIADMPRDRQKPAKSPHASPKASPTRPSASPKRSSSALQNLKTDMPREKADASGYAQTMSVGRSRTQQHATVHLLSQPAKSDTGFSTTTQDLNPRSSSGTELHTAGRARSSASPSSDYTPTASVLAWRSTALPRAPSVEGSNIFGVTDTDAPQATEDPFADHPASRETGHSGQLLRSPMSFQPSDVYAATMDAEASPQASFDSRSLQPHSPVKRSPSQGLHGAKTLQPSLSLSLRVPAPQQPSPTSDQPLVSGAGASLSTPDITTSETASASPSARSSASVNYEHAAKQSPGAPPGINTSVNVSSSFSENSKRPAWFTVPRIAAEYFTGKVRERLDDMQFALDDISPTTTALAVSSTTQLTSNLRALSNVLHGLRSIELAHVAKSAGIYAALLPTLARAITFTTVRQRCKQPGHASSTFSPFASALVCLACQIARDPAIAGTQALCHPAVIEVLVSLAEGFEYVHPSEPQATIQKFLTQATPIDTQIMATVTTGPSPAPRESPTTQTPGEVSTSLQLRSRRRQAAPEASAAMTRQTSTSYGEDSELSTVPNLDNHEAVLRLFVPHIHGQLMDLYATRASDVSQESSGKQDIPTKDPAHIALTALLQAVESAPFCASLVSSARIVRRIVSLLQKLVLTAVTTLAPVISIDLLNEPSGRMGSPVAVASQSDAGTATSPRAMQASAAFSMSPNSRAKVVLEKALSAAAAIGEKASKSQHATTTEKRSIGVLLSGEPHSVVENGTANLPTTASPGVTSGLFDSIFPETALKFLASLSTSERTLVRPIEILQCNDRLRHLHASLTAVLRIVEKASCERGSQKSPNGSPPTPSRTGPEKGSALSNSKADPALLLTTSALLIPFGDNSDLRFLRVIAAPERVATDAMSKASRVNEAALQVAAGWAQLACTYSNWRNRSSHDDVQTAGADSAYDIDPSYSLPVEAVSRELAMAVSPLSLILSQIVRYCSVRTVQTLSSFAHFRSHLGESSSTTGENEKQHKKVKTIASSQAARSTERDDYVNVEDLSKDLELLHSLLCSALRTLVNLAHDIPEIALALAGQCGLPSLRFTEELRTLLAEHRERTSHASPTASHAPSFSTTALAIPSMKESTPMTRAFHLVGAAMTTTPLLAVFVANGDQLQAVELGSYVDSVSGAVARFLTLLGRSLETVYPDQYNALRWTPITTSPSGSPSKSSNQTNAMELARRYIASLQVSSKLKASNLLATGGSSSFHGRTLFSIVQTCMLLKSGECLKKSNWDDLSLPNTLLSQLASLIVFGHNLSLLAPASVALAQTQKDIHYLPSHIVALFHDLQKRKEDSALKRTGLAMPNILPLVYNLRSVAFGLYTDVTAISIAILINSLEHCALTIRTDANRTMEQRAQAYADPSEPILLRVSQFIVQALADQCNVDSILPVSDALATSAQSDRESSQHGSCSASSEPSIEELLEVSMGGNLKRTRTELEQQDSNKTNSSTSGASLDPNDMVYYSVRLVDFLTEGFATAAKLYRNHPHVTSADASSSATAELQSKSQLDTAQTGSGSAEEETTKGKQTQQFSEDELSFLADSQAFACYSAVLIAWLVRLRPHVLPRMLPMLESGSFATLIDVLKDFLVMQTHSPGAASSTGDSVAGTLISLIHILQRLESKREWLEGEGLPISHLVTSALEAEQLPTSSSATSNILGMGISAGIVPTTQAEPGGANTSEWASRG